MRPLLILAIFLFAGCAAPEDENDALFGYCPQWVEGAEPSFTSLDSSSGRILMPWNQNSSGPRYESNGLPLDLFLVTITDIDGNGTAELRAELHDAERRLLIRDLREDRAMQPVILLDADDEGAEFEIVLADYAGEPTPGRISLYLDGGLSLELEVHYFYRVCSA